MTRCRIPEFCERFKIDLGRIDNVKSRRILPGSFNERNIYFYIHKEHYCVHWKRNREDFLLSAINELEVDCNIVKNKTVKDKLIQTICCRFPKQNEVDQLENVLVFDLETYNVEDTLKHMQPDCLL